SSCDRQWDPPAQQRPAVGLVPTSRDVRRDQHARLCGTEPGQAVPEASGLTPPRQRRSVEAATKSVWDGYASDRAVAVASLRPAESSRTLDVVWSALQAEQVAGCAAQGVTDRREGAEPDRLGVAVLEDGQVRDRHSDAGGELDQRHRVGLELLVEVDRDPVLR